MNLTGVNLLPERTEDSIELKEIKNEPSKS
jgi:hypothetical protein